MTRAFVHDVRGAMMTGGVFMAVLLVGVLYHLVGVGREVMARQLAQDAADRAAFDAAVGYARSMDEIGLANDVQMIAFANAYALENAQRNLETCAPAAYYEGYPEVLCPEWLAKVTPVHDAAMPELVALVESTTRSGESLRDATPGLVEEDLRALARGPLAQQVSAIGVVAAPMPLATGSLLGDLCVRGGPFVRPLLERSSLPADLIPIFQMPAPRLSAPTVCPTDAFPPDVGPQVMDPPNQSGTEPLQLRVFVVTRATTRISETREGTRLPERTVGLDDGTPVLDAERAARRMHLEHVALTQAEYFSAWPDANTLQSNEPSPWPGTMPEQNTYYMHWRARLRRVRVPVDVAPGAADATFAEWLRAEWQPACRASCAEGGDEVCEPACDALDVVADTGSIALH